MCWGSNYWGMTMFWWIFWVLAVVAFFALVLPRARFRPYGDSALEEVRRRYAAGEIDEAEYRRRLDVLGGNPPPVGQPQGPEAHTPV
jgi:putative membrane protein